MRTLLAVCLVGGLAGSGQAVLVESDLGAAMNGGGCYPPGLTVTGPTDPTLVNPVNPEWAPVVDGMGLIPTPCSSTGQWCTPTARLATISRPPTCAVMSWPSCNWTRRTWISWPPGTCR